MAFGMALAIQKDKSTTNGGIEMVIIMIIIIIGTEM